MRLASVIQNTSTLQYEAKDLPFYNQIETQAVTHQRKIARANDINLDMGFGWGDD